MNSSAQVQDLIRNHRRGEGLARPFYFSNEIFEQEVERILGSQWMLAGHVSQLPSGGDYFVVEALGASVIVVRDGQGEINAFHNVCRHRGARICEAASGRTSLLRCRYHSWSFKVDSELAAWRHMPEGLYKADFSLNRCAVATFQGCI